MNNFVDPLPYQNACLLLFVFLCLGLPKTAMGNNPSTDPLLSASVPERRGRRTAPFDRFDKTWEQHRQAVNADPFSSGSNAENTSGESKTTYPLPLWSVFLYRGRWSDNRFVQILAGSTEIRSSELTAIGISRIFDQPYPHLLLEGEFNLAVHSGLQDHAEFNVTPVLRWTKLPWDSVVDSTVAFGFGGSYATDKPAVETDPGKEASRFLFFMMGEMTFEFAETSTSSWEGFVRIHHRSGGFETVIEAEGSNFLSLGIRYRFGSD